MEHAAGDRQPDFADADRNDAFSGYFIDMPDDRHRQYMEKSSEV
jgi:hypothetical protein